MATTCPIINVASVPHRSPFRYPGGKTWLVPYVRQWIRSLGRPPFEFAEPFAGGGIVGLSVLFEGLAQKLTLVEIDQDIGAVWRTILSVQGERLASEIVSFKLSEEAVKAVLVKTPGSQFERAFQTVLRNRVQRGGIMAPGAGLVKQGENGRGLASRWYPRTLERRILGIFENRHRIRFKQGDGLQFIRENAHRNDLAFFIDPPYTVAGRRLYRCSDIDHEELFRVVAGVRGDFLMTYDNATPIRKLAKDFGLDTHLVPMKSTHHMIMRELLVGRDLRWARKPLELRQDSLFEDLKANGNSCR
jgi:DNA adenine methylase